MFGWLAGKFGYVKRPDFWWFPERSSAELSRRIGAAGPGHRLEVRVDAAGTMTFRVVLAESGGWRVAAEYDDINESFPCPPRCWDPLL